MKKFDAEKEIEEFETDEFHQLCSMAFRNHSGGETIENVIAHFETGLDRLIATRDAIAASVEKKLRD